MIRINPTDRFVRTCGRSEIRETLPRFCLLPEAAVSFCPAAAVSIEFSSSSGCCCHGKKRLERFVSSVAVPTAILARHCSPSCCFPSISSRARREFHRRAGQLPSDVTRADDAPRARVASLRFAPLRGCNRFPSAGNGCCGDCPSRARRGRGEGGSTDRSIDRSFERSSYGGGSSWFH